MSKNYSRIGGNYVEIEGGKQLRLERIVGNPSEVCIVAFD